MAKLRKFVAYRRMERPYTRKSKYRAKSFIRGNPAMRVTRFVMGDPNRKYEYVVRLHSKSDLQIRDNAIEAARQMINRKCEKNIGLGNFTLMVKIYPHHHLRENPLASGAGADRLSTGMAFAFGKIIGLAARVFRGKDLFELRVDKDKLEMAKLIIKRGCTKLPCTTEVSVTKMK